MVLRGKSVLVTGAGGFIGSHLTERLIRLDARVRAFVRYNSRNSWGLLDLLPKDALDEVEVISGDLRDSEAVSQAVEGVDTIFHLASLIAIPYSYVHPRETIETNVIGALNVMTAARKHGVKQVIHTSTSEVYGTAQYVPIDENHPLQPQSPYSASKIGADMVAESFRRSFGLPVSIIRPFNTFGPRQSARAVIPTIITQALGSDPDILLGSLGPTRDYTYVDDLAEAFTRMAESEHSVGETLNIGSNFEISIGEIAKKVLTMSGANKQVRLDASRVRPEKSEVERLWCDNTKAKRLLGWKPRMGFEEGLSRTIDWISVHRDLYKAHLYNL
jgi:NAD dependent epimerase/dehydratase